MNGDEEVGPPVWREKEARPERGPLGDAGLPASTGGRSFYAARLRGARRGLFPEYSAHS